MIPNIIHQIWIQGEDKIPPDLRTYHDGCKQVNNNFRFIVWDEEKIRAFLEKYFGKKYLDTYDSYTIFAQKADFARYAILYIYGGIYLDMDMMCKKNLSQFLEYNFFFTSYILPHFLKRYLNGIIGARPKHPVFLTIFQNIFSRFGTTKSVTETTGTNLFYDSIMEYIKNNPNHDLAMFDRKYLHPCNMFNEERCKNECTDCYIVHTNYSSWSPRLRAAKYLIKHKWLVLIVLLIVFVLLYKLFTK